MFGGVSLEVFGGYVWSTLSTFARCLEGTVSWRSVNRMTARRVELCVAGWPSRTAPDES